VANEACCRDHVGGHAVASSLISTNGHPCTFPKFTYR
jgi:hypothetical protein